MVRLQMANLWVAVALHICMNLWWELLAVAKTAIRGWFPFALQNLTMLLAILGSLYWTKRPVATLQQPFDPLEPKPSVSHRRKTGIYEGFR